jgi:hypothetical protein
METIAFILPFVVIVGACFYAFWAKSKAEARAFDAELKQDSLEASLDGIRQELRAVNMDLEKQRHDMRRLALEREELRPKPTRAKGSGKRS